MTKDRRDIFICHAGEDKDGVVRPMVEALTQAGISCWYDEAEIRWGDSIAGNVNEGLAISRYVVVVFSSAFTRKNWPQRELNAVLNMEASSGEVKVLPLLVGSEQEKREILDLFPLLNDKRYLPWDGNLRSIVDSMLSRLGRDRAAGSHSSAPSIRPESDPRIPLPQINRRFAQRDKDLFLRTAFGAVKQYFRDALTALDRREPDVDTDFVEVHAFKFGSTIYVHGEVASRCKIWLGGLTTSDAIAYHAGQFDIDSDNSFNDLLSVSDNGQRLGFGPSGMWFGGPKYSRDELLSADQVAEYLWTRFTERLG